MKKDLVIAAIALGILSLGGVALAQESSVTFPIPELGGCTSKEACKQYCLHASFEVQPPSPGMGKVTEDSCASATPPRDKMPRAIAAITRSFFIALLERVRFHICVGIGLHVLK